MVACNCFTSKRIANCAAPPLSLFASAVFLPRAGSIKLGGPPAPAGLASRGRMKGGRKPYRPKGPAKRARRGILLVFAISHRFKRMYTNVILKATIAKKKKI